MILGIGRIREKVDSLLRLAFGLLTVLAMLLPAAAKAQTSYPVQVNVMVTPPNSVYLTDYYARGSEKLKVQLLLKEVDRPSFPVKLRFKIEGSALRLTSRPGVNLPPFTLQGGVMVEAAGDLLAPYLSLNALVAEGADASSFQGKGLRMADGFYKVEVWAEEMGRSVRVSNIATTFISTMLYQSPVITSPIDKAILPDQGIQNIIFQWMPRHLGASLDVTQSTYYKVRLVEVWPRERDPQEAIRSSKPLYEGLSNSTTFVYGAGQPTLISGRRYALQVQAQDADQRDLFVGQGYSNVVCFTYGEECQAPQGLKVEVNGPNNANALWTSNPRNTGYTFAYRKVYGLDTAWVEQPMGIASYSLSGLTPVTSYQARVSATCGLSKSIWSQPRAFTTADRPEIKFECGKNPNIPTITDRTLYPNLKDGDRISAADFKVEILTVSLGSRGYSGSGIARIPFLRNAPAFCSFKDVKVNKDLQLYEGALVLADSVTVIDKTIMDNIINVGKGILGNKKPETDPSVAIVAPVSGTTVTSNSNNPATGSGSSENSTSPNASTGGNTSGSNVGGQSTGTNPSPTANGSSAEVGNSTGKGDKGTTSTGNTTSGGGATDVKVKFDVQPNLTEVGYSQLKPIVFGLATDLTDTTGCRVIFDTGNAKTTCSYKFAEMQKSKLPEDVKSNVAGDNAYFIYWYPGLDPNTSPLPGRREVSFKLSKGDKTIAEDKETIMFLPKYDLVNLYAVDKSNSKRVAKAGETLYLVKSSDKEKKDLAREIDFKCKFSDSKAELWPSEPYWLVDGVAQNHWSKTYTLKAKNWPTYEQSSPVFNDVSVSAFRDKQGIKVAWVRENKRTASVTPFNLKKSIKEWSLKLKCLADKVNKNPIVKIKVENSVEFQEFEYNEEDPNSNLYVKVRESGISGGIAIKTDDIMIPGLKYDIPKVGKIGAYFSINTGVNIQGSIVYKKALNENIFHLNDGVFSASLYGGVEAGIKASLFPNLKSVKIELKGYASASLEGNYSYYLKKDESNVNVRLKPLVLGVNGNVKVANWDLIDIKEEWQITDYIYF